MAKKTFKGGLDSLLSSADIDEIVEVQRVQEETSEVSNLSSDEKHWLLLKIERLRRELKLWRTGELTPEKFHESLSLHGFSYNSKTNEIE